MANTWEHWRTPTPKIRQNRGFRDDGTDRITVWMLDTDYDGRSLLTRQVFFPMAGEKDGWARLAKNLKAGVDEELIEAYRGTHSLAFTPGEHARIAVKIVDDRGIEEHMLFGVVLIAKCLGSA